MAEQTRESSKLELSIYGYGMMSFATAMALLLSKGFFTHYDSEPLLSWGMAFFAGASGALALSMVRIYFPHLTGLQSIAVATLLNIFLFGCYFTSYFGYSHLYVMKMEPDVLSADAMQDFWSVLTKSWLNTCFAAAICSLGYIGIQRFIHGFSSLMTAKS